jgi:GntR family transcriptional regulator
LPAPGIQPAVPADQGLILQSLQQGEWKPGEAIPSEMELAARFRVSQGTVRKAIDELAAENLVVRRQGKGTFVATHSEQHVQYRFLRLMPDSGDLPRRPGPAQHPRLPPRARQRRCGPRSGPAPGDAVMQAEGFCRLPASHHPGRHVAARPGLQGADAEQMAQYPGPTYAMYEAGFRCAHGARGRKYPRRAAEVAQAELLQVPAGTPLLSVERIAYTYNDVPMELRRGLYRTDTHHYHNELS